MQKGTRCKIRVKVTRQTNKEKKAKFGRVGLCQGKLSVEKSGVIKKKITGSVEQVRRGFHPFERRGQVKEKEKGAKIHGKAFRRGGKMRDRVRAGVCPGGGQCL